MARALTECALCCDYSIDFFCYFCPCFIYFHNWF